MKRVDTQNEGVKISLRSDIARIKDTNWEILLSTDMHKTKNLCTCEKNIFYVTSD